MKFLLEMRNRPLQPVPRRRRRPLAIQIGPNLRIARYFKLDL
jgi:hypothetical protein